MEVAIVFMFLFAIIFGIFYLFYSTRNKERLALIEKGVDATIFMSGEKKRSTITGRVIVLNLALLLMGIGLGVFLALVITSYTNMEDEEAVYPAMIFFMAGLGLFTGFNLTKKLDQE